MSTRESEERPKGEYIASVTEMTGLEYGHRGFHRRPDSEMQALMEAPPHATIEETQPELEERIEPVRRALESGILTPREDYCLHSYHWRRMSHEQIARELSVSQSTVHRVVKEAERKLGEFLTADDKKEDE